jgi:hypothetical protein
LLWERMLGPEPELESEPADEAEEELELEEELAPEEPSDSSGSRTDCSESSSEQALEWTEPMCEELARLGEVSW